MARSLFGHIMTGNKDVEALVELLIASQVKCYHQLKWISCPSPTSWLLVIPWDRCPNLSNYRSAEPATTQDSPRGLLLDYTPD
jgi:hypothetical protein